MKRSLLPVFVLFTTITVLGQTPTLTQKEAWSRLHVIKNISAKERIGLLLEDRHYLDPWRSHMELVELSYQRQLGKFRSAIHGTYLVFTLPHDPHVSETTKKYELRAQQSVTRSWTWGKKHRVWFRAMLEERFFRTPQADEPSHFHFTYIRSRNRVGYSFQILEPLKFMISDEWMIQANTRLKARFDQNRLDAIFRWQWTPALATDLGYLHWYQQTQSVNYSRHTLRTALVINF